MNLSKTCKAGVLKVVANASLGTSLRTQRRLVIAILQSGQTGVTLKRFVKRTYNRMLYKPFPDSRLTESVTRYTEAAP